MLKGGFSANNLTSKQTKLYLVVILVLATILRVLWLDVIPNGFFCDEASNAYDSFSLLHTLRDQHGAFLPFFTRSIDDYREALYAFFTIPFIQVFGLNEFAARLPAAVIGVATVWIFYYLVQELFNRQIALVAALMLAMSPWHIQFSRIAFRAILIPFLFCLALLFFAKSFRQSKYLPLSALCFAFSLYTYASARVFVPLFMLGLVIIFWRHFWIHKLETIVALVLFGVIFVPLVIFWLSPEGMSRANATGLEADLGVIFKYYLSYFHPKFLFFSGDPITRHSPAKIGELYYFEIITVIWGLISILRERSKARPILLLWLLLYPLPGAITSPAHALRAIAGVPLFTLLSAYGLVQLLGLIKESWRRLAWYGTLLLLVASLAILGKAYFLDYPLYTTAAWQYGIREALNYAETNSYKCVTLSNQIYLRKCGSLHVFIPFYTEYPPQEYQKSVISPETRVELFHGRAEYAIGKYQIAAMDEPKNLKPNCLYIMEPKELEKFTAQGYSWQEVHTVTDQRGREYLKLIELTGKTASKSSNKVL